ncbi:MAG: M23 family metallopeptidase [Thermoanaerobaculia bacterium]
MATNNKMASTKHTIIFVPHARARFVKWRVSSRRLLVGAGAIVVFTLASLFTTWSFFTNTIDGNELVRIRTENNELRSVNESFEGSIRNLERQLVDFEDRTRKLAIVAGLEGLGGNAEPGIGGADFPGQSGTPIDAGEEIGFLEDRADLILSDLDQIGGSLEERERWISSTPAIEPVKGILTSGFGRRIDPVSGRPAQHRGIDISTAPGRTVQAPAQGIVVEAGRVGRLGNAVYISHGYGVTTRYGHLSRIDVEPGQRIGRGDTIGRVGNTGKSTGYHLHYEVRIDGRAVNPIAYMLDRS